jgi:hypothetical protein
MTILCYLAVARAFKINFCLSAGKALTWANQKKKKHTHTNAHNLRQKNPRATEVWEEALHLQRIVTLVEILVDLVQSVHSGVARLAARVGVWCTDATTQQHVRGLHHGLLI